MSRRIVWGALGALLVAVYGYRAAVGVAAGIGFDRAQNEYRSGDYKDAIPLLDRVAIGGIRHRAARLAAEARLERWEREIAPGGPLAIDSELLRAAGEAFLDCRCIAPSSRRSWEGLAEVYAHMEWTGREARALDGFDPGLRRWERVGRPGRIAIGMIHGGLRTAPNWYSLLDDLASRLWAFGIEDEAHEAVRAAALSLPLYERHHLPAAEEGASWVLDVFADASREVLGEVPLVRPADHLLDLAKVDLARGRHDLAVASLTRALDERNDAIRTAEIEYYLGQALLVTGDTSGATERLLSASSHPAFRVGALQDLAAHAETSGDLATALGYLRRLRQEQPRELHFCLSFARVARQLGDRAAVIEALRWARLIHPEDPQPSIALAHAHLDSGELQAAEELLREIDTTFPPAPDIEDLRARIELARQPPPLS